MNWYKIFYWLTVADNAKGMFVTMLIIFTAIAVISTLVFIFARQDVDNDLSCPKDGAGERAKKWMWWSYPFLILFWSLYIFTPNKKDALLIVAGGGTMNYLANDSVAKEIPRELINFVSTELKSMAEDAKVELGVQSQKDKILESAKTMTADEIIEKMKVDSVFANIVLGK